MQQEVQAGPGRIEFPPQMAGGDDEHLSAFEDRFTVVISSDYLQS